MAQVPAPLRTTCTQHILTPRSLFCAVLIVCLQLSEKYMDVVKERDSFKLEVDKV
jgi:hypothetical protein